MEIIRNKNYTPHIILKNNEPTEFNSYPLSIYGSDYDTESYTSISRLLEDYYGKKNLITRIRQKSSDQRRIVQTALEKDYKKYGNSALRTSHIPGI